MSADYDTKKSQKISLAWVCEGRPGKKEMPLKVFFIPTVSQIACNFHIFVLFILIENTVFAESLLLLFLLSITMLLGLMHWACKCETGDEIIGQ